MFPVGKPKVKKANGWGPKPPETTGMATWTTGKRTQVERPKVEASKIVGTSMQSAHQSTALGGARVTCGSGLDVLLG